MSRWIFFRWRVRLLVVIDWLLGTHLADQVVGRWRQEIETMQAEVSSLQAHLEELGASREAILRDLCLNYLQLRQLQSPDDWRHFDPHDPAEESAIEVLTKAMVAPHWARWQVTPVEGEASIYTYDLVPDWPALHQDALNRAASFPTSLLDWLGEQAAGSKKQETSSG